MIVPLSRYHTRHPARARASLHLPLMLPVFIAESRRSKTLQVLARDILFQCGDRATSYAQEKLGTGGGACKNLLCQKTCVGDEKELERALDDVYTK